MLTKGAISVLETLTTRADATPSEIAKQTRYHRSYIYEVLDALQAAGIITERREAHNQRRVTLSNDAVSDTYKQLRHAYAHVDWPELLSPSSLRVCWYLDEPRRIAWIAAELGLTPQRVTEILQPFKRRGMLDPDGPDYALVEELVPLLEFARAVVKRTHQLRADEVAPTGTIVWLDPRRILLQPHSEADREALRDHDDWELTGLARHREYGLEFHLPREPLFWYDPVSGFSRADLVCHTLLSGADTRHTGFAMLLVEAAEIAPEVLVETARRYDLGEDVESLTLAVREGLEALPETTRSFPVADEYAEWRQLYDLQ